MRLVPVFMNSDLVERQGRLVQAYMVILFVLHVQVLEKNEGKKADKMVKNISTFRGKLLVGNEENIFWDEKCKRIKTQE